MMLSSRNVARRRTPAVMVVLGIVGSCLGLAPGSATAAPQVRQAPASCPPNALCVYADGNYLGRVFTVPGGARTSDLAGFHDVASSWFNTAGKPFCLIDNSDPTISTILARVLPHSGGNAGGGWFGTNDKADFVTDFCPDIQ